MRRRIARPLALCAFLGLAWQAFAEGGPKIVAVDCAAGESINAALRTLAPVLLKGGEGVVEISGFCDEDVEVRFDNVTLRGTSPDTDGIRGVGPGDRPFDAVLVVRDTNDFRIENLSILDGNRHGVVFSSVLSAEMSNCRLLDHARFGMYLDLGSNVTVEDLVVGSSRFGALIDGASQLGCTRCTVEGQVWGVGVTQAFARFSESDVSGSQFGLLGFSGAEFIAEDSTLSAPGLFSVVTDGPGKLTLTRTELRGALGISGPAWVQLRGCVQTVSVFNGNFIDNNALVLLQNARPAAGGPLDVPTQLIARAFVEQFGQLSVLQDSTIGGSIFCASGGDAFCEQPGNVGGAVGCSQCVSLSEEAAPEAPPVVPRPVVRRPEP